MKERIIEGPGYKINVGALSDANLIHLIRHYESENHSLQVMADTFRDESHRLRGLIDLNLVSKLKDELWSRTNDPVPPPPESREIVHTISTISDR